MLHSKLPSITFPATSTPVWVPAGSSLLQENILDLSHCSSRWHRSKMALANLWNAGITTSAGPSARCHQAQLVSTFHWRHCGDQYESNCQICFLSMFYAHLYSNHFVTLSSYVFPKLFTPTGFFYMPIGLGTGPTCYIAYLSGFTH